MYRLVKTASTHYFPDGNGIGRHFPIYAKKPEGPLQFEPLLCFRKMQEDDSFRWTITTKGRDGLPFWVTRTKRVIKYAPTNPMSLVRFQWETRVADLKSKSILYMYRDDESSIIYNVSEPKVSLFAIPNDPIHYAVPIFHSAPIKKKNLPFSQLDIRRAWANDPSNVAHILLGSARCDFSVHRARSYHIVFSFFCRTGAFAQNGVFNR